ncbi:four-carbon acid sugar kinase family protein [uncultured Thalassospira sp.]|uniref:four-carbon acid sugar kinase family protein n=1 Tax=uncultured Thalassospira sp. TaxID=404382 RepID=UPI002582E5E5|nr:four-carbon acid sugar kinase family protein [uncultured Thalassospira sp.]
MSNTSFAQDLFLCFYGDDFTGSTDVMEALSSNGIETVLFTRIPEAYHIEQFKNCSAVGLAGISRSQPPEWMDDNLPDIFRWLQHLNAKHCHYKTCSTFDSAPHKGSIGRAIEIGRTVFDQKQVPLIVGAPQLRRYTFFGHLFAAYRDQTYRIDRHPVMSQHPATPMTESDLLVHLGRQSSLSSTCVTADQMKTLLGEASDEHGAKNTLPEQQCLLLDIYDDQGQAAAGTFLHVFRKSLGPFAVGSSGVEYALLRAWQQAGLIGPGPQISRPKKLDRIAVVSGSCSSTTSNQIEMALSENFAGVPIDYHALISGQGTELALEQAATFASKHLKNGKSPIIYTARGPETVTNTQTTSADVAGRHLGALLDRLIREHQLERAIIAGGDTSSLALSEMNIYALTLRHPIPQTPGSPLCNAFHNDGTQLEIALKGGQIGKDDYFISLRDGKLTT